MSTTILALLAVAVWAAIVLIAAAGARAAARPRPRHLRRFGRNDTEGQQR
jgi:hypothetical protein